MGRGGAYQKTSFKLWEGVPLIRKKSFKFRQGVALIRKEL